MITRDYTKAVEGLQTDEGVVAVCPCCGRLGAQDKAKLRSIFVHETHGQMGSYWPTDYCICPNTDSYCGGRQISVIFSTAAQAQEEGIR